MEQIDETGNGHLKVTVQHSPDSHAEYLEFSGVVRVVLAEGFLVFTRADGYEGRTVTGLPLAKVKRWDLA